MSLEVEVDYLALHLLIRLLAACIVQSFFYHFGLPQKRCYKWVSKDVVEELELRASLIILTIAQVTDQVDVGVFRLLLFFLLV